MFELLFLLLPIAAAYGYYMGKNSYKDQRDKKKAQRTKNYLRGIDFMLKNDQAQAMDKFIAYLDSSSPTFESTLALGNLFRQRGEVDKAISLHTSLANDDNSEPYESELAQMELASDFMSAGLLDRAEDILKHLVEIPRQRNRAASLLVKVYEQERDFEQAIALGLEHKDVLSTSDLRRIGHYYCELASKFMLANHLKEAEKQIENALNMHHDCLRARIMKCELLLKERKGNYKKEVRKLIFEIATIDNSTGMFCLELLKKCYELTEQTISTTTAAASTLAGIGLGNSESAQEILAKSKVSLNDARQPYFDPEYQKDLEELVQLTNSSAVMVELASVIALNGKRDDAEFLLLNFMKAHPNIKLFSAYMGIKSKEDNSVKESETIMQLKSIVDAQIAGRSDYSCSSCGFESSMMFWQCPSCRSYDTLRPRRAIDGD